MTQPRGQRVVATLPVCIDGFAAISTDLSKEGFCLESPTRLTEGAVVQGAVLHGPLSLAFSGRVVWSQAADPRASLRHRMGIQFERLSPGLRALLGLSMNASVTGQGS